ncbi:hypothetical protein D8Z77_01435 [Brevibacillus laterosporus]|nr:hypothetical protein D8Z77_01435 [Brevibacillus laterosporus]
MPYSSGKNKPSTRQQPASQIKRNANLLCRRYLEGTPALAKNCKSTIGGETIYLNFGTITANRNQTIWAPFSRSKQLLVKQNPQ